MSDETNTTGSHSHILDDCDPDECYKTMMAERTDLIKARREAEDNLVKTVVQLSSTLIALIAGFITQTSVQITPSYFPLLITAMLLLVLSLSSGLSEHVFSSKAYLAQQELVEKFYTKQINSFEEPRANRWVRGCQVTSFIAFVIALVVLGTFALFQAGEKSHGKPDSTTSTTSAASPAPSASASASASSATATASSASASASVAFIRRRDFRRRPCYQVGSTIYASTAAQKALTRMSEQARSC